MHPRLLSSYFTIAQTSYGGRGAFASQDIPKDTLVLSCDAPYASVIDRRFRKEVCAWCFAWSWEKGRRNTWSVNIKLPGGGRAGKGQASRANENGSGVGVWFCQEECKNAWLADEGEFDELDPAGVRGLINAALEKCLVSMGKSKSKLQTTADASQNQGWEHFLGELENLDSKLLSPIVLDEAWTHAENLSSSLFTTTHKANQKPSSTTLKGQFKIGLVNQQPTELSELELNTVRFLLSGLLRKCIKTHSPIHQSNLDAGEPLAPALTLQSTSTSAGIWSDLLDLLDNTLSCTQSDPYALASNIRVWAFTKYVVYAAVKGANGRSDRTTRLLGALWAAVLTSHDSRQILGREPGNAFGIWEVARKGEEREMLGWGLYLFGSYFNHDCLPTLYKVRKGRAIEFYSLRDLCTGEELCIEYVDGGENVVKRRDALKKGWFFDCACKKCKKELFGSDSLSE